MKNLNKHFLESKKISSIDNYITEKLKLDASIKISDAKYLTDYLSKDDLCLMLSNIGLRSQERILIDVIKIIKKTKYSVEYEYLTDFSGFASNGFKTSKMELQRNVNDIIHYRFPYVSGHTSTALIIPSYACNNIIKEIEKNNLKLDFEPLIWNNYYSHGTNYVPLMKLKKDADPWDMNYKNYENLSIEDLNNIKELLK